MNPLLFNLNGWEIPIIVLAILLLFGGKKIPEFMSGLGKGINSFKIKGTTATIVYAEIQID